MAIDGDFIDSTVVEVDVFVTKLKNALKVLKLFNGIAIY